MEQQQQRGRGNRGGGRGRGYQQRDQPRQDDSGGRGRPREPGRGPPSAQPRPQNLASPGQFPPPQQQNPWQRAPPPQQFPQRGPSPQTFHGTSPVRGEQPGWSRPPGLQATRGGQRPSGPAFSPPGQRQPQPVSQPSSSQQFAEPPVQKAWGPKSTPSEASSSSTRSVEPEKPITTSESSVVTTAETVGKKKKKKRNRGTQDKPLEESLEANLVLGSSSKETKSDAKTKPEAGKEAPRTTPVKEPARTTTKDQSLCSIPKRGIVKHSAKFFESEVGRPLEVNFLRIDLKDIKLKIFQYSVEITPEKRKALYGEAVRRLLEQNNVRRYPAYDGRTLLFAAGSKLEFPGGTDSLTGAVEITHDGGTIDYRVTLNLTRETSLNGLVEYMRNGSSLDPYPSQALDVAVMHAAIRNLSLTKAGRSFFSEPREPVSLGNGLDLWTGHSQSVVIPQLKLNPNGTPRLYLNVDVAHKGFPKAQPVLHYIGKEFFKGAIPPPRNEQIPDRWGLDSLSRFLKGIKVEYRPPGLGPRTFKVEAIGPSAREARFTPEQNQREISVEHYFRTTRNVTLEYPLLPCIMDSRGRMFPVEFCTVKPNQVVNKQLDARQTDVMVRNAARPTVERKKRIEQSIRSVDFNNDPCVQEFGLMVDNKFEKVPHYVLKPPTIQYAHRTIPVADGTWKQTDGFLDAVNLTKWVIINTDDRLRPNVVQNIIGEFLKVGRKYGLQIEAPIQRELFRFRSENDFVPMFEEFRKKGAQLIMVIMRDRDDSIYSYIKRAAELQVGVLTQCLRSRTASNSRFGMTAENMLLKLNAKVGGVNHTLAAMLKPEILDDDVMLVGADVTHPSPGSTELSIAAVAASHDKNGFQYNMVYRLQRPGTEMIADLQDMIISQIEFYRKKTGKLPKRIMYYRDGVSESQFRAVREIEVNAVKQACASFRAPHRITITVVVVQKRHHTRFFPEFNDSDKSKNQNVRAGTVVDEVITHPTELDFYLVSHKSIQGTARPTKYHLLYDDSSPAIDQETLERLTYYLCHLFARCNRSVSYPAPTYYAHLAAFRAKAWWGNAMSRRQYDLNNLSRDQELRGRIRDDIVQGTPMFFV